MRKGGTLGFKTFKVLPKDNFSKIRNNVLIQKPMCRDVNSLPI